MAARLETASKQYGVPLLLSQVLNLFGFVFYINELLTLSVVTLITNVELIRATLF